MKWSIFAIIALALAAILVPAGQARHGAAAAATPTPAALAYDEITRFIVPPATPPAPGAFQTDYQTIANATPPPTRHGILAFAQQAMDKFQEVRGGHITRYTYYKGWIRHDDVAAQTATIDKCNLHQTITLDLAKRTYTIATATTACPTAMPAGGSDQAQTAGPPGTVDMTVTATSTNLGPLSIDGIATRGADRNLELSLTNATGSCKNGDIKMGMTQYVSSVAVPRRYCPLPPAAMTSAMSLASGMHPGCKPTMHASANGSGFGDAENRIVMYSLVKLGGGSAAGGDDPAHTAGLATVTERGNVKWFGGAAADALFAIPAGFTQT